MSYESRVYRILIASPSDVDEEREITSRIIQEWNDLNSFSKKVVLLPVKWETHSSPTFGVRPQDVINKQIVDDCDLLIGFFWTKIGTPTGEDLSGTVEEIKRVSKAGKQVMLYFSKRGKDPSQINISQLEALNKFKDEIFKIALVEEYNSLVDFRDKVARQLEMKVRELQAHKESNKELINFSFIDNKTGGFANKSLKLDLDRIEIDEKYIKDLIRKDKRISKKSWNFNNELISYVNKKNNVPILLGMENKTNRILNNVIAELKLTCSIENSLLIQFISSSLENNLINHLQEYDLSKENDQHIRSLFKSNLTQTSSKIWEFSPKPFTLLPNKMTLLDSVFLLYPKESMSVNFSINIFSENMIQPIDRFCSISMNVKKRELRDEEITEIIDRIPNDEEVPF